METDALLLRDTEATDGAAVAEVYNHYVRNSIVTFEELPVSAAEMTRRIEEVVASGHPWLVLERAGTVVGYAYATRWRVRPAYRHSAESTVYLVPTATGQGHGTRLLTALLLRLRAASKHAVIAGIALPNPASVALHERMGMRRVATFSEVGFKFGRWIDVAYWQLTFPDLERLGSLEGRACASG